MQIDLLIDSAQHDMLDSAFTLNSCITWHRSSPLGEYTLTLIVCEIIEQSHVFSYDHDIIFKCGLKSFVTVCHPPCSNNYLNGYKKHKRLHLHYY